MRLLIITLLLLGVSLGVNAQDTAKGENLLTKYLKGIASYYHDKFEGRKTANGDVFDNHKYTAASNKLKLGSYVKVTNISNGEVVYVKITDRMAKSNSRLIDLAKIAANKLEFEKKGVTKVKVEVVPEDEGKTGILAQNVIPGTEKKKDL
jgi:rare lipoprotein A